MEAAYESGKITNDAYYTLMTTLYIAGELNYPIYRHYGYNTGCIIQTDGSSDPLTRAFHMIGDAHLCKTLKGDQLDCKNYCIHIYEFQKYSKAEDVIGFIQDDRHLSIVIIQGCVPEELYDMTPIFSVEVESLTPKQLEKTKYDIHAIKNFLRSNPQKMQDMLTAFQTSSEYNAHHSEANIRLVFDLAAQMYRRWFRSCHDEDTTMKRYHKFMGILNNILTVSESYDFCENLNGILYGLLTDYLDTHPEIDICHREKVDGTTSNKIKTSMVILFDTSYYYIPERLFKALCTPLCKCSGLNAVKNSLYKSGIINYKHNSFTQKIAFTNSYGGSERHRFILVVKNKVVPFGEPELEERRHTDVSWKEQ